MKALMFRGEPVSDEASRACILFDPKDGRVVHVHGVTILAGGQEVSQAELEKRTRTHAQHFGRSLDGLKTLHVPLSAMRQHRRFKVNADGSGLVPLETPAGFNKR